MFGTEHFRNGNGEVIVVETFSARAYPVRILSYHEIVNDILGEDGRADDESNGTVLRASDERDVTHTSVFDRSFEFFDRVQGTLAALAQQTEYPFVVDAVDHSVTHREEIIVVIVHRLHVESCVRYLHRQSITISCAVETERPGNLIWNHRPITVNDHIRECEPTTAIQHAVGFPERDGEVCETEDTLREQDVYSPTLEGQRCRITSDHSTSVR